MIGEVIAHAHGIKSYRSSTFLFQIQEHPAVLTKAGLFPGTSKLKRSSNRRVAFIKPTSNQFVAADLKIIDSMRNSQNALVVSKLLA
jgi:hypothetical protein